MYRKKWLPMKPQFPVIRIFILFFLINHNFISIRSSYTLKNLSYFICPPIQKATSIHVKYKGIKNGTIFATHFVNKNLYHIVNTFCIIHYTPYPPNNQKIAYHISQWYATRLYFSYKTLMPFGYIQHGIPTSVVS